MEMSHFLLHYYACTTILPLISPFLFQLYSRGRWGEGRRWEGRAAAQRRVWPTSSLIRCPLPASWLKRVSILLLCSCILRRRYADYFVHRHPVHTQKVGPQGMSRSLIILVSRLAKIDVARLPLELPLPGWTRRKARARGPITRGRLFCFPRG